MLDFLKKFFSKKEHVPQSDHIIAAKVVKIEPHPNADKLRVITLYDGVRKVYPIVCGAHNFEVGAIVPLALPGAEITRKLHFSEASEPYRLTTATIRGVESQGMICAAFEIGKSEEIGDGIMILPADTKLGTILL